jgi:hypothetical protein
MHLRVSFQHDLLQSGARFLLHPGDSMVRGQVREGGNGRTVECGRIAQDVMDTEQLTG